MGRRPASAWQAKTHFGAEDGMQPGRRGPLLLILPGIIVLFGAGPGRAGEAPLLSLPIACQPHKTCFIQTYVDDDPG
ncbi:MAG: hypothetical protein ABUL43_03140, partial [Hyphomicrobium sp.]